MTSCLPMGYRMRYRFRYEELAWAREAGACRQGLLRAQSGIMSTLDFVWVTHTWIAPAHMIESAALHPDRGVRCFAAEHPACPEHVLRALVRDSDVFVRDSARRILAMRGLS